MQVVARAVNRAVQRKAGGVGGVLGRIDQRAVEPDLQQVRRRHLVVVEPERVDQVVALGPGQAHRDVVEDHLGPAEKVDQVVAMRELHAQRPFGLAAVSGPGLAQVGQVVHADSVTGRLDGIEAVSARPRKRASETMARVVGIGRP